MIQHDSAVQDLVLSADRLRIINRAENKDLANFIEGSHVRLYYDGTERLATSGVGVTITSQLDVGNVVASSGYAGVSGITTVGISTTGITTTGGRLYTADDIKSGNGLEVTGVSTFNNDVEFLGVAVTTPVPVLWDSSQGALEFRQDTKATFGNTRQFQIVQDSQYSKITSTATELRLSLIHISEPTRPY